MKTQLNFSRVVQIVFIVEVARVASFLPTKRKETLWSTRPSRNCSTFSSSAKAEFESNRPFPMMPSQLFQQLTLSQLEFLASSLTTTEGKQKIKSMALYLPQENPRSGQLEFMPAVIFPHPSSDRIFIANQAESGVAPRLPNTLTTLPGFAHATSLLPDYPMVAGSTEVGIGVVEEVLCDVGGGGGAALSVPLFAGSQTVGVLLVSPAVRPKHGSSSVWTSYDREQVSRAAQSLSIALSMDAEKSVLQMKHKEVQKALSDSLHQVKNPLQALRTFGKLLQQRIADIESGGRTSGPQLLELVDLLMVQSDRLIDRLKPVDGIVDTMTAEPLLLPFTNSPPLAGALVPFKIPLLPGEGEVIEFDNNVLEFGNSVPRRTKSIQKSPIHFTDENIDGSNSLLPPTLLNSNDEAMLAKTREHVSANVAETRIPLEMAFVDDVLGPVLSAFSVLANENHIAFQVVVSDDLPGVSVVPEALQEAVTNLLDNAFKYVLVAKQDSDKSVNSSPKVRVQLLSNLDPSKQGVTILIEDNGPGIPESERNSIFDRGVRGKATKQVQGSGIGLSIARTLVQKMGGTLVVADKRHYEGTLDGTVMELQVFRNPWVANQSI